MPSLFSRVNMSCRILTPSRRADIRPLFEQESPVSSCSDPVRELTPAANVQVAELHGRIVELERALQRDVLHARDAGFRDGEAAGREKSIAEMHAVIERLTRSIAELAAAKGRFRREAEHDVVQLSIGIGRRILRRELTIDPEAVGGLVRAALDKLQARDLCKIRVHPAHHPVVRRLLDQQGVPAVEVVPDGSLQPGDLVVESKRGDLDASIESQLAEIERGFADRLKRWGA